MGAYTRVHIAVDRDPSTGRLQLNIGCSDADGAGHGYRLAGPKYLGDSVEMLTHDLDTRDVREIREYLRAWDEIHPERAAEATPKPRPRPVVREADGDERPGEFLGLDDDNDLTLWFNEGTYTNRVLTPDWLRPGGRTDGASANQASRLWQRATAGVAVYLFTGQDEAQTLAEVARWDAPEAVTE